jgi:hypothetical protein
LKPQSKGLNFNGGGIWQSLADLPIC